MEEKKTITAAPSKVEKRTRRKVEKKVDSIDIIHIDDRIKQKFIEDTKKLPQYKEQLAKIENNILSLNSMKGSENKNSSSTYRRILNLREEKEKLLEKINFGEDPSIYSEYIYLSQKLLEDYTKHMNKAIKKNFMGATDTRFTEERDK